VVGVQVNVPEELIFALVAVLLVNESDTLYDGVPTNPVAIVLKVIVCPASMVEDGEGD
jgi:hypothetical protein